jgi:LPXTG-site transpeptidase (sortase) family protein
MKLIGFVATFIVLFVGTVAFLAAVDALPEPAADTMARHVEPSTASTPTDETQLPTRVVAKDIDLDVAVLNTPTADIESLDADLLKGAVRYPTSAKLGEQGTVLLFGHSSYLPIVHNQNYKAFNNIQKLKEGQIISVYSGGAEYRYRVSGVRLANAEEDVVELRSNGQYLTLVTCNSFAAKTARYVVEAEFAGSYSL